MFYHVCVLRNSFFHYYNFIAQPIDSESRSNNNLIANHFNSSSSFQLTSNLNQNGNNLLKRSVTEEGANSANKRVKLDDINNDLPEPASPVFNDDENISKFCSNYPVTTNSTITIGMFYSIYIEYISKLKCQSLKIICYSIFFI